MRELVKIGLALAAIFASTFLILRLSGTLTLEEIRAWLSSAHIAPVYVALLVIVLLFADLFIAVPTLTISILAGYFLGPWAGAAAAAAGMLSAGITGYWLSRRYGTALLKRIYRDERKLEEMRAVFAESGLLVLLICRALPILPEVSCCLAGATRMPFWRFLAAFSVGTIPFAAIASYAGSVSSIGNPMPAILVFIALPGTLWLGWFFFLRARRRTVPPPSPST
jgi:uncharacterized membrane protein YdjX (TVP38/TMEM64 family)